jgi:transposase-like protein
LRVKIRDEATVCSKAIDLALAVLPDATREILGLWIEQTEGAKLLVKVFTDLKTRGCQDILIAVTDGLKGMSEALAAVYPATTLQTCIVHRASAQSPDESPNPPNPPNLTNLTNPPTTN